LRNVKKFDLKKVRDLTLSRSYVKIVKIA
jgi:hypothetical protein